MKSKKEISQETIRTWLAETPSSDPEPSEIRQTENALMDFAEAYAANPPDHLKKEILSKLSRLNRQKKERRSFDVHNLPQLEESSNWLDWQQAVEGIRPSDDFENIYLHCLESNEKRDLFVVWVKEYVPEEVHYELLESFLILEGSCVCHITDEAGNARDVRMGPGDFITMAIGEKHDIRITSLAPTKAILQWQKMAA